MTTDNTTAHRTGKTAETVELRVTGMTCNACARTVETAVASVAGVVRASVDLERGLLTVTADPSQTIVGELRKAVYAAGYGVDSAASGLGQAELVSIWAAGTAVTQSGGIERYANACGEFKHLRIPFDHGNCNIKPLCVAHE